MIEHGARRIGFLGLPLSAWTGSERFRGFSVALDEAGLTLDERFVRRNQRTIASAEAAAREVLALPDPPDSSCCANSRNTLWHARAAGNQQLGSDPLPC